MSRHLAAAFRREVVALLAVVVAAALIGPSVALAGSGSYTVNDWSGQPSLYNDYLWSIGPQQSPPAGIPANAVVTAISAHATWSRSAPTGFHWEHAVCFNNTSTCLIFSSSSAGSWSLPYTALPAGFPTINASSANIIYAARVTDGTNPSIYPRSTRRRRS